MVIVWIKQTTKVLSMGPLFICVVFIYIIKKLLIQKRQLVSGQCGCSEDFLLVVYGVICTFTQAMAIVSFQQFIFFSRFIKLKIRIKSFRIGHLTMFF